MKNLKIKKVVLALAIGFMAFFAQPYANENIAYAATCTPTTTDATCEKATTASCPTGYTEKADNKTICQKVTAGGNSAQVMETFSGAITILGTIQKVLNILLWPILMLIGGLLDNSLLFGSGMEERLREIWVLIRNLVNILFVLILVGIALYNVLGLEDENYGLKAILPKIIIGIIAVNFSFLAGKVILDGVNVMTTAIFTMPNQVGSGLESITKDPERVKRMCLGINKLSLSDYAKLGNQGIKEWNDDLIHVLVAQQYYPDKNFKTKQEVLNNIKEADKEKFQKDIQAAKDGTICDGDKLTATGETFLANFSSKNAALAMALNLSNMMYTEDIDFSIKDAEKFLISIIFGVVIYVVYGAAFIALFIVLLARMVVLWLAMAISPVLIMGMTVPIIKEKISAFGELEEKIVGTTIAPIGIAFSMTIGWIMIQALQDVNYLSSISFTATSGLPVKGLNSLKDVMVTAATITVVWLGVFGAASKSIAHGITDMIKGAVEQTGTWIGTLPLKHLPIVPIHIPGAAPGEEPYKATLGEVMYTMKNVDQLGRDDRGLLDKIRGGGVIDPRDINDPTKVKDEQGVRSYLKSMDRKRLGTTEVQEQIRKFQKSTVFRDLPSDLKTNIDNYLKHDPTSVEGKDAIEKIWDRVKNEPPLGGKASATAATTKAPKVAFDKAKAEATAGKLFTDTAQQRKFSDNIQKLGEKINDKSKDETSKIVEAIKKDGGSKVTKDTFKESMDEAGYKELIKTLGDGDETKGETELDKILAGVTPAAGAAAPGAPVAAPAPAGTAPSGSAAPATTPAPATGTPTGSNLNTAPEFEQKPEEIAKAGSSVESKTEEETKPNETV